MQTSDAQIATDSNRASQAANSAVDATLRRQMVAEAAYFIAEHRGFDGGDPMRDWLAAEAEIDRLLASGDAEPPEEAAAYAHVRDEVRKAFSQLQGAVDADALKAAFERGVAEAKRIGGFSAELMQRTAARLREDLAHTSERMGPAWEQFSERGADLFSVWKDRGRAFLERGAAAARDWLRHEPRGQQH